MNTIKIDHDNVEYEVTVSEIHEVMDNPDGSGTLPIDIECTPTPDKEALEVINETIRNLFLHTLHHEIEQMKALDNSGDNNDD